VTRRDVLAGLLALGAISGAAPASGAGGSAAGAAAAPLQTRKIPSTGEDLPVIGLGSWITFNVGTDVTARNECTAVIRAFLESGGRVIDSSPMYGSSQEVIGYALAKLGHPKAFAADKVWTSSGGAQQIEESRRHWGVPRFDLLQVHNLLAWEEHLPLLYAMKKAGRLRYVGVTTSHGRRLDELEKIMRREPLDFVQLTYNPIDREPEQRILPLAMQRKMAVIINRPFNQGELTEALARHPLPAWARELDCRSWAQLVLKFIVSHPAVTCAIPATSVVAHARENVDAARGRMPDAAMRKRIADTIARLA
jgi:diketogulonate reductase-like aldo/keto reductase